VEERQDRDSRPSTEKKKKKRGGKGEAAINTSVSGGRKGGKKKKTWIGRAVWLHGRGRGKKGERRVMLYPDE